MSSEAFFVEKEQDEREKKHNPENCLFSTYCGLISKRREE